MMVNQRLVYGRLRPLDACGQEASLVQKSYCETPVLVSLAALIPGFACSLCVHVGFLWLPPSKYMHLSDMSAL